MSAGTAACRRKVGAGDREDHLPLLRKEKYEKVWKSLN